jgi:hypothetical protein
MASRRQRAKRRNLAAGNSTASVTHEPLRETQEKLQDGSTATCRATICPACAAIGRTTLPTLAERRGGYLVIALGTTSFGLAPTAVAQVLIFRTEAWDNLKRELLDEEHQSCPVLVFENVPSGLPADVPMQQANGRGFIEGAEEIATYLAHIYGSGLPH